VGNHEGMESTVAEPVAVDPSESTIWVQLAPHRLSRNVLDTLALAARPTGRTSDCLRTWLSRCVAAESARRLASKSEWGEETEPAVWLLPWHEWRDNELQAALACSYAWTGMALNSKERAAFDAIHRAVVTACCTRLFELHSAIEAAEQRRQKDFAEA
jgi:hypothetical protein